jgi:hypothetical protein
MDETERKNKTNTPNCGSHTKHCDSCKSDDIEKISNAIKSGFESIGNSLVEFALILSSDDYAKSLIKERDDKRKEKEEAKRKEEENKKRMKEESNKILDVFKQKIKDQIFSLENISDDEKNELFNLFITNKPAFNSIKSIKSIDDISLNVRKAFSDAIKEVKPEIGLMFDDQVKIDPMMISLILPGAKIPPILFMKLVSDNNGTNPMTAMQFIGMMNPNDPINYFLMNHK